LKTREKPSSFADVGMGCCNPKVSKQVSFAFRRGTTLAEPRFLAVSVAVLKAADVVSGEENLKTMAFLVVILVNVFYSW